jgi:hypothetical protein
LNKIFILIFELNFLTFSQLSHHYRRRLERKVGERERERERERELDYFSEKVEKNLISERKEKISSSLFILKDSFFWIGAHIQINSYEILRNLRTSHGFLNKLLITLNTLK